TLPGAELDTNGDPGAGGGGGELLDEALVAELEQLGGEVLSNAVRVYADQGTGQLSELAIAIGRGETLTVAKAAHKLKGASRTLGATQLANIASELEATAKAGDLSAADELLDGLRSGLDETMKALDGRVARPMNGESG
nr:Hpt domain-containing protein [Actinomycetota bacterium]